MNEKEYEIITKEQFDEMMDSYDGSEHGTYEPEGKFLFKDDGMFIAVDNSDGGAYTEEFNTEAEALYWLLNNDASISDLYYDKDEDALRKQAEWIAQYNNATIEVEAVKPSSEDGVEYIGAAEDSEVGYALLFYHGPDDYAVWYTDDPDDEDSGHVIRGTKNKVEQNIKSDPGLTPEMVLDLQELLDVYAPKQTATESYSITFKFKDGDVVNLPNRSYSQATEMFNELSGKSVTTAENDAVSSIANNLFKSKNIVEALKLTGDMKYGSSVNENSAQVNLVSSYATHIDLPVKLPAGVLANETVKNGNEIHGEYTIGNESFNVIIKEADAWWKRSTKVITITAEAIKPTKQEVQPAYVEAFSSSRSRFISKAVFEALADDDSKKKRKDVDLKIATLRIWVKQDVQAAIKKADPSLRDSDQGNRIKKNDDVNDRSTVILSFSYKGKDDRDNLEKFKLLKNALLDLGFIVNDDTFKRQLDSVRGAISMKIPGAFEQFSLYGTDMAEYGDTFKGYIVTAELSVTKTQASVRLKFSEPRGL